MKRSVSKTTTTGLAGYDTILAGLVDLLEGARRISARAVNAVMTASYWEVGRRIVESEQGGKKRADYGEALVERLSGDLSAKFGRGFSLQNLYKYRQFFSPSPRFSRQCREIHFRETPDAVGRICSVQATAKQFSDGV